MRLGREKQDVKVSWNEVDKTPAGPAVRGPHVQRILTFVVCAFGLNSFLLAEGRILGI